MYYWGHHLQNTFSVTESKSCICSYLTKCILIFVLGELTLCNGCWWYLCFSSGVHFITSFLKYIVTEWTRAAQTQGCWSYPGDSTVLCQASDWRWRVWWWTVGAQVTFTGLRYGCQGTDCRMGQAIDRPETESSAVLLCRPGHTVRWLNRCGTQPPSSHIEGQIHFVFTFLYKSHIQLV